MEYSNNNNITEGTEGNSSSVHGSLMEPHSLLSPEEVGGSVLDNKMSSGSTESDQTDHSHMVEGKSERPKDLTKGRNIYDDSFDANRGDIVKVNNDENIVNVNDENKDENSDDKEDKDDNDQREQRRILNEKMKKTRLAERIEEEVQCKKWLREINMYGKSYTPPVPKYLLLKSLGRRLFAKEDTLRRTAWMGQTLRIISREELPDMRPITLDGVLYLSITACSVEQSQILLETKRIGKCEVEITKDPRKNSIKGVFYDHDDSCSGMSDEDIKFMLSDQGVTDVQNFMKNKVRTKLFKLTYDCLTLPEYVEINRIFRDLKHFIPSPIRCFRCQDYEHGERTCKSKNEICQRCGKVGHRSRVMGDTGLRNSCSDTVKCFHCAGNHEAGDKDCPKQQGWKKIMEMIVLQKVSKAEAKFRVLGPSSVRKSHADMVRQTDRSSNNLEMNEKMSSTHKDLGKKMDEMFIYMKETRDLVHSGPSEPVQVTIQESVRVEVEQKMQEKEKATEARLADHEKRLQKSEKEISTLKAENQELKKEKQQLVEQQKNDKKEILHLKEELEKKAKELKHAQRKRDRSKSPEKKGTPSQSPQSKQSKPGTSNKKTDKIKPLSDKARNRWDQQPDQPRGGSSSRGGPSGRGGPRTRGKPTGEVMEQDPMWNYEERT